MPRKKKLSLTIYEKNLLEHPPTEKTWVCEARKTEEGSVIKHVNGGSAMACVYCGTSKPKTPKMLWVDYVVACEKVGIEPGYQWKIIDLLTIIDEKNVVVKTPMMKVKGESWKKAPMV